MLENLLQEVIDIIARHLEWEPSKLNENSLAMPEAWYRLAMVCTVYLADLDRCLVWRRPEEPRSIREIAEIIFKHNVAYAA